MHVCSLPLLLAGASLLAGGCGGNVVVDAAGNIGAPATSSVSTGAGGGTSTTSASAASSTTSSTTSSGTGGMPCIGVFNLKLDGAKGGTLLTSLCDTDWNPLMSTTPVG